MSTFLSCGISDVLNSLLKFVMIITIVFLSQRIWCSTNHTLSDQQKYIYWQFQYVLWCLFILRAFKDITNIIRIGNLKEK